MAKEWYNVDTDDAGQLFDCRFQEEKSTPLSIKEYPDSPVGLVTNSYTTTDYNYQNEHIAKSTYIYGLTKPFNQIGNNINEQLFNYTKVSVNSHVLMHVYKGDNNFSTCYPLFCKELFRDYGIGFIFSDWLWEDPSDHKIKVKFKPSYLWYWYHDENGNVSDKLSAELQQRIVNDEEIISDEIYSSRNLIYSYHFPEAENDNPYSKDNFIAVLDSRAGSNINEDNDEEQLVSALFKYKSGWKDTAEYYSNSIPENVYYAVYNSRLYPGTQLKGFAKDGENHKLITVTPNVDNRDNAGGITFISFVPNVAYYLYDTTGRVFKKEILNKNLNTFIRYKLSFVERTYSGAAKFKNFDEFWDLFINITAPFKFELLAEFGEDLNLYYCGQAAGHNEYKPGNDDTSFQDYSYLYKAHWPDGTDIVRSVIATRVTGIIDDIVADEPKHDWYRNSRTNTQLTKSEYNKTSKKYSAAETLTEYFNNISEMGLQTPSQYYSSHNVEIEDTIKDPFMDVRDVSSRTWFWLDTLKNWCMYTRNEAGFLYLQCWDGLGGWDRVETIVWSDNDTKMLKYHYLPDFFKEHVRYPGEGSNAAFTPIFIANQYIGMMYYDSIILTKETKLYNYNNNFQSMHNSKLYPEKDHNQMANIDMGGSELLNGHHINAANEKIKYVFQIDTQYNPCLIKLINGDIALIHVMLIHGISQPQNHYIINPDQANRKCKELFGDGSDKNIENDWKRIHHDFDWSEEKSTRIVTNPDELITGAPNLTKMYASNTINSIKFFANRPNPTTNNLPDNDFVERWK